MKKFKTVLFLTLTFFAFAPSISAELTANASLKLINDYIALYGSSLQKSGIKNSYSLWNDNKELKLNSEQLKCLKSNLCKSHVKFNKIVFYSTEKNNYSQLEDFLAKQFKKQVYIKSQSSLDAIPSSLLYSLFTLIFSGLFYLVYLIFKPNEQKAHRELAEVKVKVQNPSLPAVDPEINQLIIANNELEKNIEGMRFLFKKSELDYQTEFKKWELNNKLPNLGTLKNPVKKVKQTKKDRIHSSSVNTSL